jgi:glycosyltransferase involved in cell wall biosynthesis
MINRTCVLIPHYNDYQGLQRTIGSIFKNENVDVLVVDDGSTKSKINETSLRKKVNFDGVLIIIYLKVNQGIEAALNAGLEYILKHNYYYVGRIDAGDLSTKNRFKIQEGYMDKNPHIYLSGTFCNYVDLSGNLSFRCEPELENEQIRKKYFLSVMHIHPTVIFRVEVIDIVGFYPLYYPAAEDYAYFFLISKTLSTSNIPIVSTIKVVDPNSISVRFRKQQQYSRLRIVLENFDFSWYSFIGFFRILTLLVLPKIIIKWLKLLGLTGY